eukprot:817720-Amphidinium_carterae.1
MGGKGMPYELQECKPKNCSLRMWMHRIILAESACHRSSTRDFDQLATPHPPDQKPRYWTTE